MKRLAFALHGTVYEQYAVGTRHLQAASIALTLTQRTSLRSTRRTPYAAFALADATLPAPWDVGVMQNASNASLTLVPGPLAAPWRAALRAAPDRCCPRYLTTMLLFVDMLEPLSQGAPTPPAPRLRTRSCIACCLAVRASAGGPPGAC